MARRSTTYDKNYTRGRVNLIRGKRIVHVEPNMKQDTSASAGRYAEMEAYVKRRGGQATVGDVLDNTSYRTGDFKWDIRRGRIKFADAAEVSADAAGDVLGNDLDALLAEEGKLSQRVIQIRSRSGTVREFCIKKHKSRCLACDLDFGERFGEKFVGLIDVHHINPIAQRDGATITNPETDCRPLCPNCHRMAHFGMPRGECRSLDELVGLVKPR
jgi:predicted HNH restriction endonuclease